MSKIEYSPAAIHDLKLIQKQIRDNFGNEVEANVLRKITTQIRRLEQFPLSGINLGEKINVPTNYRYIIVEKNYIFYYADLEKIRIVRVLNEKQDYMIHLFGSKNE